MRRRSAVPIDEEGFGRAVDAPIDRNALVGVERDGRVGIAELLQPALRARAIVVEIEADDRHDVLFRNFEQRRLLLAAGYAPGAPGVEHVDLTLKARIADLFRRVEHVAEFKRRRRLADQRRRQRADVAVRVQAQREQRDERHEDAHRHEELPHQAKPSLGRAGGRGGADTSASAVAGSLTR
jgi:hypothetical protein